jgi:exonuclease III
MTTNNTTNSVLLILIWNANGLKQHKDELLFLLQDKNIDIALISEIHFTPNSCINIYGYKGYFACHPDGSSHAGAALYIKSNISHYPLPLYIFPHIQAFSVSIITQNNIPMNISSIYSPPGIGINASQFSDYFSTIGHRFISGGDYNAKNPKWGNRSPNTRGRALLNCIIYNNLSRLAPSNPIY